MGIIAAILVCCGFGLAIAGMGDPTLQSVALPGLIGCLVLAIIAAAAGMARS